MLREDEMKSPLSVAFLLLLKAVVPFFFICDDSNSVSTGKRGAKEKMA